MCKLNSTMNRFVFGKNDVEQHGRSQFGGVHVKCLFKVTRRFQLHTRCAEQVSQHGQVSHSVSAVGSTGCTPSPSKYSPAEEMHLPHLAVSLSWKQLRNSCCGIFWISFKMRSCRAGMSANLIPLRVDFSLGKIQKSHGA